MTPARAARPLAAEDLAAALDVSRETLDRLRIHRDLLLEWQASLGLVGRSTLADIWRRHFLDSAQLMRHAPPLSRVWLDAGSGAGFPGMVLAILGAGEVHLVESSHRRCVFLREVARRTGTAVAIHRARVEALAPWSVDVVTARALAPLAGLLDLCRGFIGPRTTCLLPKGQHVDRELTEAAEYWRMTVARLPSLSDSRGTILRLTELSHV